MPQGPIGSPRPAARAAARGAAEIERAVTTIYKICERGAWRLAEQTGTYRGSAVDARDGFIHFSAAAQLAGTMAKHFAGRGDLLLVAVDADALGAALKWEPSRGGDLFPHLYGALPLTAVRWTKAVPDEVGGRRVLPELAP